MKDADGSPLVLRPQDVGPHGLTCMDCHQELRGGDAYSERLIAMIDEAPVVEITCVPCGLRGAVSASEELRN